MADDSFKDVPDLFSTSNRVEIPVYPLDVFKITDAGSVELNRGATPLPAEALEILVLLDGKATIGDLEQRLVPMSPQGVRDLVRSLLAARLIREATIAETEGIDFDSYFKETGGAGEPSAGVKASAEQEAGGGAQQLRRDGYYVSIARTAVRAGEIAAGSKRSAFVVEDDPDMAALVTKILESEGFDVSVAGTRAAVLERMRRLPMPDLVLLDVHLPDVNGFEVLKGMKTHPRLKVVPVIMVTAEATREGVMRGLASGADGYVTKPFARDRLIAGVRAVMGL